MRTATAADASKLAGLDVEIFGGKDAWSEHAVSEELETHAGEVLVMVAGDVVVGYAFLRLTDDVADLFRIGVVEAARRHDLGRRLVEALVSTARQRGCRRVLLEVAADNVGARRLYERLGFEILDRRERYYSGQVDAWVLQKRL